MNTLSIWRGTAREANWPTLEEDLQADVAIVGGGITGVTLARLLSEEGRSVVLLEAGRVGSGATGNSTGNLYETVSGGLRALVDKWGIEVARAVVASRREAMETIARDADRLHSEARLGRCTLYWYSGTPKAGDGDGAEDSIERELLAARTAGVDARTEPNVPAGLPPAHGPVLAIDAQAQIHPVGLVRALAGRAASHGCRIFENSPVVEFDASRCLVRTARARVDAREIVLATHSPSGFHAVQLGLVPNREYGLAVALAAEAIAPGIYWDKGERHLSVRTLEVDGAHYLICIGEAQRAGQHDARAAIAALEALVGERFDVPSVAFRWSAQNFRSPDGLPYIGRDSSGALIATGFATDGLVYGTLAASILADRVLGRENRWSELYRADRFTPVKGARGMLEETVSVARAALKDYLTDRQSARLMELAPGKGAIVEIDDERLAAYRDESGDVFVVSPTCTHFGCMVHWNEMETSWDCPCHGSRFAVDGRVLEGPALTPLARKRLPEAP